MHSLLRLRQFVQPYYPQIFLTIVLLFSLTGLALIMPIIVQRVIDDGLTAGNTAFLMRSAGLLFILGIMQAVLTYVSRLTGEWVAAQIGFDLRNRLYDHIQHLSFSFHDHAETGQLISRCIEDVRAIERFAGTGLAELLRVITLLIGITILLFAFNVWLSAIAILPLIPLLLISLNFGRRIGKFFYAVEVALGHLSSRLQENVSGVQVVRAFAREPYEIERFRTANRSLYEARVSVIGEWSKVMPTTNLLVVLCTILILWFGGAMVLDGELTIGELVAFNSYVLMLAGPAGQLTWLINSAGEAVAGSKRTFELLDTLPDIQSPEEPSLPLTGQLQGRVTFEHVNFIYQGEPQHALCDINLCVEPNQVVAVIGATGSGKSSTISLIPRFYDVDEGRVCIDGVDVRELDLTWLRKQIGIVLQTSLLFSATIQENIAYGRPDASMDEIVAAAKAAQAHDFILEQPDGYETLVGERGVTLSGGQRQRVAIARALLMNPRILILDDSTSSVDTHTEQLIQQALDELMIGRTTFVIAHRLSTVKRADLILVMDAGQIVEQGTHQELLQQDGIYREIYELQLRDQERFRKEMALLRKKGIHLSDGDDDQRVGAGMKKDRWN